MDRQRNKRPNRRRSRRTSNEEHFGNIEIQQTEDSFLTQSRKINLFDLGNHPYPRTRALTVSTRGIGFMVSRVASMLQQRFPERDREIPVAQIYRASLAQLQAKLYFSNVGMYVNYGGLDYESPHLRTISHETAEMFEYNRTNFSQIAVIIDSIGKVEINNKTFAPVFMKELNPLNIRLDNLRKYCEEMANPDTDPLKRIAGFELNSIPNAKWKRIDENDPESIVLTNMKRIIPRDYDFNDRQAVFNDLKATREYIDEISIYMPQLRALINYDINGDPGFLVSTLAIRGKKDQEFWSPEPISRTSWCLGAVGLAGEVLNPMDGSSRSNIAGTRTILNWHGITDMIFY